eukprot:CAMPEP_0185524364 /NCGR_PEP_ID=MMETSP1366-20130426/87916_1 /TAXON_ID=38817 /ORGANISM="Gephyrocapsa oceanica, Strain RCC1303" /LENGTH=76 /DNA_ID=CAMNT_0028135707 /DNA_START=27 /DNA_END=254 /DNA_ORIENTATION=-
MSEQEKRDRLGMFGPGIPSVRTLNRSPGDERIDRGGMSAPLARSVIALAKDYTTRVSRMQASEPSFYEPLLSWQRD